MRQVIAEPSGMQVDRLEATGSVSTGGEGRGGFSIRTSRLHVPFRAWKIWSGRASLKILGKNFSDIGAFLKKKKRWCRFRRFCYPRLSMDEKRTAWGRRFRLRRAAIRAARQYHEKPHAATAFYFPAFLAGWIAVLADQMRRTNAEVKQWAHKNVNKIKAKDARRYERSREKMLASKRIWREANPEKVRAWYLAHRKLKGPRPKPSPKERALRLRLYRRARRKKHWLLHDVAKRIGAALRGKTKKSARTHQLLGCSESELRTHLEKLFLPGMTWDNRRLWHVDHHRPCASFDLTDPEEQRKCFHFSNLQPLWAKDNLRKHSYWNGKAHRFRKTPPGTGGGLSEKRPHLSDELGTPPAVATLKISEDFSCSPAGDPIK